MYFLFYQHKMWLSPISCVAFKAEASVRIKILTTEKTSVENRLFDVH